MAKRARRMVSIRLPPDLLDALDRIEGRTGKGRTAQIEEALNLWVAEHDVRVRPPRRQRQSRSGLDC